MVFANDFAAKNGRLRVHFIGHEQTKHKKTDAFLVELDGEFTLIDGGMKGVPAGLKYLMSVRKLLLADHPELIEDESCKLRLTWFISHFHVDHIAHTIYDILPSPFIKVERIVVPPDTTIDPKYNSANADGDEKYRPILAEAIAKRCPDAEIIDIPFGKENMREWQNGALTSAVLPPPYDGGLGEHFRAIVDGYYGGDETDPMIPVAAVNSGAVWHYFKYGKYSFLFTGDTMKKVEGLHEAGDDMIDAYGDYLGQVSVVKFLHHGLSRDAASPLVLGLKPDWIVCSSELATAPAAIRKYAPDALVNVLNCGNTNIVFETDGEKLTVTETPVVKEEE